MKNIIQKQKFDSHINEMNELRNRLQNFKQKLKDIDLPPSKMPKDSAESVLADQYLENEKYRVRMKDVRLIQNLLAPYSGTTQHKSIHTAINTLVSAKNDEIFNLRSQLDEKNKTIRTMTMPKQVLMQVSNNYN